MQFLAPLFLLAIAAIAIPIALHVRRQHPKSKIPFSAVQFLMPEKLRIRRRMRLEDLLLLLLRCLGIMLLALAFARPFFAGNSHLAGAASVHRLILVDTSASMRGDRLERAKQAARDILASANSADRFALATFDRELRVVIPFEDRSDSNATAAALASIQAGWQSTNLGSALIAAADLVDRARADAPGLAEIHVVSDFQRGASTADLAGQNWPSNLRFIPARIEDLDWTNAGVHPIPSTLESQKLLRAQITNAAGSAAAEFSLRWNESEASQVTVKPGASTIATAPDSAKPATLTLSGDAYAFDNQAWLAPLTRPSLEVDYFGPADAADSSDSLFFLERALQPTAAYTVDLKVRPENPTGNATLTIVDGADHIPAGLRERLEQGSSALLVLREATDARAFETLTGSAATASEVTPQTPELIGTVNFDAEVLQPFADPAYSNFSHIATWTYRRVENAGTPLLQFTSGDPLLMRVPVGKGSLYVLATSWRPAESQLALSSKFAPLFHSLLQQARGDRTATSSAWVGEPVTLPDGATNTVLTPSGAEISASDNVFTETSEPGLYRTSDGAFTFAVNVRPVETELSPIPDTALAASGLPLDTEMKPASARDELQREELERRQKWWWWLVAGAILAFLIETILANTRRQLTEQPA